MKMASSRRRFSAFGGGAILILAGWLLLKCACPVSRAAPPWRFGGRCTEWGFFGREHLQGPQALGGTWYNFPPSGSGTDPWPADGGRVGADGCSESCPMPHHDGSYPFPHHLGGSWFWMRSPEQEKAVVTGLFNRYCIRCHGVDGRGIWDIPGVPDFTNTRWQLSRSDDQIARIIIEGRGAVMPPFRGVLTLEEAWAMARYLRTFVPGTETSRSDVGKSEKTSPKEQELPMPKQMK